jgi:hypothetical protein
MKQIITVLALSIIMTNQAFGQLTNLTFRFRSTAPDNTLRIMEQNAKAVFDEINNASRENRNLRFSTANITNDGITHTHALWAVSKFHCVEPAHIENVNINSYGGYQIRNIATFFKDVEQSQDVVVDFDRAGRVSNISIAIKKTQHKEIMQTGNAVTDFRERQIIVDFVENFRTAYNLQDINYIDTLFNDDALIITGKKLTVRTGDGLYATKTTYTNQNKQQYINKLRNAIMAKDSRGNNVNKLTVDFDRITLIKSENEKDTGRDKVYLVRLWQKWDSKGRINYSDEGWLTLVIDFNESDPTIWVRAWEDGNFKENELYNLGCFYNPKSCK